jgi:threonylcarbamoyladenosine tRNA methylthiotransferase MtaB
MSASPIVSFTTLGCRLNQAESDSMAEELRGRGFEVARPGDDADVVVVNTCTVTREATKASRMAIRRAVKSHPRAKVVVIGCYAVSNSDEVESIDGVDVVLTNDDKERFADVLSGHRETAPLLQIGGLRSAPRPLSRVRANLKVQTGCDEWCTFCIIPTTRGPLRSMEKDALIAEARARVAAGARELVLTGVHLGKYSYDTDGDESELVRLFQELLDIDGVWRLRLSSILSRHLTTEVVSFMAREPRMCRFLHVPLQSGDDSVLKAMHRPYTIDEYIACVERARAALPDVALATDIMVGFPTETEGAFAQTMEVVRHVEFSKLHVFRYSARPGTPAADLPDTVAPDVKKERSRRLIAMGNELRSRWLDAHLKRPLDVLVEDVRIAEGSKVCSGQTDDFVRVWFEGDASLGSMARVQGTRVRADGIEGRLVGTGRDTTAAR